MPPTQHARFSASAAERLIHCPPSLQLGESYENKGSDYAVEGTCAHALCEYRLKKALGIPAEDPIESLDFYNDEMEDCAAGYVSYILEVVEESRHSCPDPLFLIEQRVDFSKWVEGGFGTADFISVADGTLHICDYKHGMGVLVSAEGNSQLKCYALGALSLFDFLYGITEVKMTIYQPRRQNVSTCRITVKELLKWANEVLSPAAKLALSGQGDFSCGEWCRFCKAKSGCRERAKESLQLARYEFRTPPVLEDSEVEDILGQLESLMEWASDIKEYALQQAISGKKWRGWKLVEGRSNRKYTSEAVVADTVSKAGFDPYEHKVLGVTAMQKLLGKSRFDEILAAYIEKPQGKPTLVPESDKRPVMNTAKNDFMEKNNYE